MPHIQQTAQNRAILRDDASGATLAHFEGSQSGRQPGPSRVVMSKFATIARTDTTAKSLFTLPAGAVVVGVESYWTANSDAGTTATFSVGKSGGTGAEYVSAVSVKTGASTRNLHSSANLYAAAGATDTIITGIYAETGTASTTGGPINVRVDYYVP